MSHNETPRPRVGRPYTWSTTVGAWLPFVVGMLLCLEACNGRKVRVDEQQEPTPEPSGYESALTTKSRLGNKMLLDSTRVPVVDSIFVDDNDDTVELSLDPYYVHRVRGGRVFTNAEGEDSVQVLWRLRCVYDNLPTEMVEFTGRCKYRKTETILNNYQLEVQSFRVGEPRQYRTYLRKEQFKGLFSRYQLRRMVLMGAEPIGYLPITGHLLLRIRVGEGYGSPWWNEVWATLDANGRLVRSGIIDYSPNCQAGVQWSADGRWLLTCAEIADMRQGGSRRSLARGPVMMSRLMGDSLLAVAYTPQMVDSTLCDSMLLCGTDTLPLRDRSLRPDTSQPNIILSRISGQVLAELKFAPPLSRQNYGAYLNYNPSLRAVAFFRVAQKLLRIIPTDANQRGETYPTASFRALPPNVPATPQNLPYFEFEDATKRGNRIRFYFDRNKRPFGQETVSVAQR